MVEAVASSASEGPLISTSTSSFQKVFGSYSRHDVEVVKTVASVLKRVGLGELRWDLQFLNAGDNWADTIAEEIEASDRFQLFRSENARRSLNVEKEWRLALSLERKKFIKPVYWREPVAPIPEALNHLHFAYLDVPSQTARPHTATHGSTPGGNERTNPVKRLAGHWGRTATVLIRCKS